MKYTRVHRLLRIIALLQSGRPQRAPDLAASCNTSERNIYRDLKEIERAGIPVAFDRRRKGYRIDGTFFMPPVELSLDEALALAALSEHLADEGQIPSLKPAWRGLAKIAAQLPPAIRNEVWRRAGTMAIRTAPAAPPDEAQDVYDRVQAALAERRVLRCRYESARGEDRVGGHVFHLRPYALIFAVRAWYVIGHHSRHDAVRTLRLSRFASLELTDLTYEIPRGFSVDRHLGHAWRLIRGDRDHEVELHFDAGVASTVSETVWHSTMRAEHHPDGACTLFFQVSGLDEIQWWVLSMGPHCRVVHPPELAERVRTLAAATAARYGEPDGVPLDTAIGAATRTTATRRASSDRGSARRSTSTRKKSASSTGRGGTSRR